LLHFLELQNSYKIEIIDSVEEDLERLETLLCAPVTFYEIHFKNLYFLPSKCIDILYNAQVIHKKKIQIYMNKSKLSKYLYKLGFHTNFTFEMPPSSKKKEIIVIGGSSNSSEKVIEILSQIETKKFIIFIIQHISSDFKMSFDTVISRYVESIVLYAKDGMSLQKGHIYIAPANKHLRVESGEIVLENTPVVNGARPSISVSFHSLAEMYGDSLLAILTCGYGSDGVDTLGFLKSVGSLSIIQDARECEADTIPLKARQQGIYDYILKTENIVRYIELIQKEFLTKDKAVSYLLEKISIIYEYNFQEYGRDSILRRIEYFRIKYKIEDLTSLLVLVLFNSSAFKALFLELSINVTEFFRKELSSKNMIHLIEKEHKNCYNIKIWSAGCSSGKEVYSTAIILNELGVLNKSVIYATDFNPVIIEEAKNAIYDRNSYEKAKVRYENLGLSGDLQHYFRVNEQYVQVADFIRKQVHFFVHNLEKDSVFNEFDIIECKNVLIYFNDLLTERVFKLFYDSLKFGGHLLIGESEEIPKLFESKFKKCRDDCKIYRKVV